MKRKLPNKITNGKIDGFTPTTLDQLMGETEQSVYPVKTEAEYTKYLSELSKSELIEHAVKLCVPPTDERERTIKRLMTAFRAHVQKYTPAPVLSKPRPLSAEALKILAEGR